MNQPTFIREIDNNKWYDGRGAYSVGNVPVGGIIVSINEDGELYASRRTSFDLYGIDADPVALTQFEEIKQDLL